ncbi:nucleoside hydrolase [Microbacterium mangrovi]|uniref:Nucleoside hydrolase n=1 Tax=Microbacterium mangrovi TaxID=1348253 RepID=A0A0B2A2P9_9MICO|nr:nucleoside hydrolase [Microbacterium mangrovi]KHK95838.1 nucleoside hydrolase [Microbacterium mangrovi]
MTERIPVFLDCDTGIDDAVALGYLLRSPAVDLVGIGAVSGNTDSSQAARNTLDLLGIAGVTGIPVAVGAHHHFSQDYRGGAAHVHGDNGIGGMQLPRSEQEPDARTAVELLIDLSHQYAGTLHVLAVGPLTNIALALQADPTLPSRVKAFTVMGGACLAPGNITAAAEANIHNDPEAAAYAFAAEVTAQWDATLVPLDVTMQHTLEEQHQHALAASDDPLARVLAEMLDHYMDFYRPIFGRRTCALHDPLAAVIAAGEIGLSDAPRVPLEIDTADGPARGATIADLRGIHRGTGDSSRGGVRIVRAVDRPVIDVLLDTILR